MFKSLLSKSIKKALKMSNKFGELSLGDSAIFVCDIQEKFQKAIPSFDEVVKRAFRLVKASKILNVPLVISEQYPKGLGNTVKELEIQNCQVLIEKTTFSMCEPGVLGFLENHQEIKNIILMGLETHVCVQQTVIDLLKRGYQTHVLADAVASRNEIDKTMALERFRQSGAIVTTTEAVLFQLIKTKDHENFKDIQKLVM